MKEEDAGKTPLSSLSWESPAEKQKNTILPQNCTSSKKWRSVSYGIFAIVVVSIGLCLVGPIESSKDPVAVSTISPQKSGLVCHGNSNRQTENGILRLILGNMDTTLNEKEKLSLASIIKESYNSKAGCGELYQRHLDDVSVTNQEVLRTKSGVSHLETEIHTKVSFSCFGLSERNCPRLEEPMFSVNQQNARNLGYRKDKTRGVKRKVQSETAAVDASHVMNAIEEGLTREAERENPYIVEATAGMSEVISDGYIALDHKSSTNSSGSGKSGTGKSGKYGEYFDAECANYTETYTITLEVIRTNDTDTECYESIPDAFAGAYNIVANVSDNCEDGQRTWEGIELISVSEGSVPFIFLDGRRRNLIEQGEESQGNRRLEASRDSRDTISITVRGNCNECVVDALLSDASNRMMEELDMTYDVPETECCEPPTLDALLEQFNSQFEGDCIEEVTDIVSVSTVVEGTYRACSGCVPDGFSNYDDDLFSCSGLEETGLKCCNTCLDYVEGYDCVECLGHHEYNYAYDTCTEFEASGQTCCEGYACEEEESDGGVYCVCVDDCDR